MLPETVPWTPMAGVFFVALLLLLSGAGGILRLDLGPVWDINLQMLLSHGGALSALIAFLCIRAGGLSNMTRICMPRKLSPVRLVRAGALPGLVAAAAVSGWILLHAWLRGRLGYPHAEQPHIEFLRQGRMLSQGFGIYAAIAMMVVVGPVAEEFIFRMLLYMPVRESMGRGRAAITVSLFFAALHIYPTAGETGFIILNAVSIFGYMFIVSIFFFVLLERTQTLLAPILGHIAYNGMVVFLVLTASVF